MLASFLHFLYFFWSILKPLREGWFAAYKAAFCTQSTTDPWLIHSLQIPNGAVSL